MSAFKRWWRQFWGMKPASDVDPGTGLPVDAPRDARREAALRIFGEGCAEMLAQAKESRIRMEAVREILGQMDDGLITADLAQDYALRALGRP